MKDYCQKFKYVNNHSNNYVIHSFSVTERLLGKLMNMMRSINFFVHLNIV